MLLFFCAGSAFAGPEPATHDGFFLRFLVGFGYGESVEADILGDDLVLSGASGFFAFQIGGAPLENFILFAELQSAALVDPDVEWAGYSGTTEDTTLSVAGLGAGACYYFMPTNLYVSGSVSSSQATLEVDGASTDSNSGLGIGITVGKEWWSGPKRQWGLGVALDARYSALSVEEFDGNEYDLTNTFVSVLFSATFN